MEQLVYICVSFLNGGFDLVMGNPTPSMHPNMVWVLVIGFFAVALSIAVSMDSK